ncbi:FtsW/RodA/SpoVE family cell cycle protein [Aurantiacibacter sp. DGU5]|uniref:Probable peptidoglycan glycosyltransferase FtsW n=2 Tax=Aurantiacibacter flavus TaxID=3145232 RepID=A0ABV0CV15_9SPHN
MVRIWWREIDRVSLVLIALLMAVGALAVISASPASAARLSTADTQLGELHFFWLHLRWQALGIVILLATSLLEPTLLRRGAIVMAAVMLFFLVLVPVVGTEVNGARRWLNLGLSLQPSEFLKPAFVITLAWILSWKLHDPDLPVIGVSFALLVVIVGLVIAQPNLGEAILFAGAWFVMVMLAGLPMQRIGVMSGLGVAGLVAAYMFYDNARHRIDSFLGGGTAYDQVDLAARTLQGGGWTGTGLWLGTNKMRLPEAHTDYIFSAVGEEFGLLVCAIIVVLYLAIVMRVLVRLVNEDRMFNILAASGLIALFGGQAFINILVNLQLFPSKGMTLPLVSYGGSSTLAQCFTIGLLLAVTRRNPFLDREKFDLRGTLEKEAG